jgi:hypothetical protein
MGPHRVRVDVAERTTTSMSCVEQRCPRDAVQHEGLELISPTVYYGKWAPISADWTRDGKVGLISTATSMGRRILPDEG